ncbi:hypothetical protein BV25DRAFT_1921309 [Artomyces pyxidatus]|uniref:Uncharacterized protein n=1 Tax=Artomyces pyxidatus TaxID=48021 RepID=A0ACB8SII8_9AGAM|nr:hypothetical protein BV25DRAFT_1921309 [Artomyces pyxidatus]
MYAFIIQATVDHRAIFTSYDFGWPGAQYFEPHEYILVDKGYPLTQFTIRPFTDTDFTADAAESHRRKMFNKKLSSLRIFVEHAFGRLKGRFPGLRPMTGRHLTEMYRTIEALMIIHNILESINDDPATIRGFNGAEDPDVDFVRGEAPDRLDADMDEDELYRAGLLRRKELVDLNFPM